MLLQIYYNSTSNPTSSVILTYEPSCGFNLDGNAFCQTLTGDKEIQSTLSLFKRAFNSKFNCPNDGNLLGIPDLACADVINKIDKNFVQKTNQLFTLLYGGSALIANNGFCVKETITDFYYDANSLGNGLLVAATMPSVIFTFSEPLSTNPGPGP